MVVLLSQREEARIKRLPRAEVALIAGDDAPA